MQARQWKLLGLVVAYLAFEIVGFDLLSTIPAFRIFVEATPMLTVSLLEVVVFFAVVWTVSPEAFRDAMDVPETREIGIALVGFLTLLVVAITYLSLAAAANVELSGSSTAVPAMSTPAFAYFTLGIFFTVALIEEYAFREIVQRDVLGALTRHIAVRIGLTSVLFAAVHLPFYDVTRSGLVGVGIMGLFSVVLGYAYERTENLIIPILVHWWWDVFAVGLNAL